MARIIEVHETHIAVNENNQNYIIPIDLVKFEPRINDYVSLVKNEKGEITNIFLEKEPPRAVFVIDERPQQQPKQFVSEETLNKARKVVGVYSLIIGLFSSLSVFIALLNPLMFKDAFEAAGIDGELFKQSLISSLVVTLIISLLGALLLLFKKRKQQYIFIIVLFVIYSFFIATALLFFLIDPSLGLLQTALFITPFIYSISFFKQYKLLKKETNN